MKRVFILSAFMLLAAAGCTKAESTADFGAGASAQDRTDISALEVGYTSPDRSGRPERAANSRNTRTLTVKGDLWLKNDSVIYTKDGENIYAYVFSDGKFKEQPLENGVFDIGEERGVTLYYYCADGKVTAISEYEDKSHTVYAIDNDTLLLVDEGAWEKKIYKINMDSMKGEELKFDFGESNEGVLSRVDISPDHTKGILTLDSKGAESIYYLADFISGEVAALDGLFDVPVYKTDKGAEVLTSQFRFADDNTVIASVKNSVDLSFELVKYSISERRTERTAVFEGSMNDMVAGSLYTVVECNDNMAFAVNNITGEKETVDVLIDGYTQMYAFSDGGYALIMNRVTGKFYVLDLESGKSLEGDMGGNTFSFIIAKDGNLVRYDAENGLLKYEATDYFMP